MDYAGAQLASSEAAATIERLCLAQGIETVEACIGQSLPPLPVQQTAVPEQPISPREPDAPPEAAERPANEPSTTEQFAPAPGDAQRAIDRKFSFSLS